MGRSGVLSTCGADGRCQRASILTSVYIMTRPKANRPGTKGESEKNGERGTSTTLRHHAEREGGLGLAPMSFGKRRGSRGILSRLKKKKKS